MAAQRGARPRRDRGSGSVFTRQVVTPQGKTITRHVGVLDLGEDVSGKRRRRTVYGRSRQDVLEKMVALRRELSDRGDLPTADITVKQWLTYWLEEVAAKRTKPSTLRGYRTIVDQYLVPMLGKHRLEKLTTQHVRGMHQAVMDGGLSSTTAMNAHRVLSASLNDAVREGRLGRNVAGLVRAPSKAVSTRTGLTAAHAVQVMVAAAPTRLGTTWLAALLLGIRQGERLGLRWSHVDLDKGTIDISWALGKCPWVHGCGGTCPEKRAGHRCPQRQLSLQRDFEHIPIEDNWFLQRPKSKSRPRRIVPLPDVVIEPLRRRWEAVIAERPFYVTDHDLVWCTAEGSPLRPWDDHDEWKRLLTEAGAPPVTLHEARHTTATLLFELGVDQHVITEILGHSDAIVSRGYEHVSQDMARKALNDLGRSLTVPAIAPAAD